MDTRTKTDTNEQLIMVAYLSYQDGKTSFQIKASVLA